MLNEHSVELPPTATAAATWTPTLNFLEALVPRRVQSRAAKGFGTSRRFVYFRMRSLSSRVRSAAVNSISCQDFLSTVLSMTANSNDSTGKALFPQIMGQLSISNDDSVPAAEGLYSTLEHLSRLWAPSLLTAPFLGPHFLVKFLESLAVLFAACSRIMNMANFSS